MRQRTKRQQREYIPGRARELAASGKFSGWYAIEQHFRLEEYCPEARHVLDNERTRDELNRLCKAAQPSP